MPFGITTLFGEILHHRHSCYALLSRESRAAGFSFSILLLLYSPEAKYSSRRCGNVDNLPRLSKHCGQVRETQGVFHGCPWCFISIALFSLFLSHFPFLRFVKPGAPAPELSARVCKGTSPLRRALGVRSYIMTFG